MNTIAPNKRRTLQQRRAAVFCAALAIAIATAFFGLIPTLSAYNGAMRVETFTLNTGGKVEVVNALGATRIQVWDDQSVRVVADKKAPAGSPLEPSELMLMGVQNTIIIQCRQSAQQSRIDLTIYMPRFSHVQITGGSLPVELSGSFASALVETSAGNIAYRIPSNDDARITMRTERGVVRSTAPLSVSDKAGNQSLEGTLGQGLAQVILSSQAGSITLTPGAANPSTVARQSLQQAPHASPGQNPIEPSNQSRGETNPSQGRTAEPSFRPSSLPGRNTPSVEQNDYDYPPARSNPSSNQSSNGSVVFAGGDRSDDGSSSVTGIGPLSRPRSERRTESGNSGLRVRIIPSTAPLGRDTGPSIYDQPGDDPNSQNNTRPATGQRSSGGAVDYDSQQGNRGRQSTPSTRDAQDEQEQVASNRRPSAPPSLHNRSREAPAFDRPPVESASKTEVNDDEAIVLKSALVNLNVVVTNRSGVALANLKKEDFQVFENGDPQSVEFFAPSTAPFNLVLVLDLSGSIKDKLDVIKSAALRFVDVAGPQDKIAVVTFTQDVRVVSQLTSNRDELKRRIKAIERPEGGTSFYEAMWFVLADTLRGTGGQRNAVVVLSDGVDSSLDRYNPAPTRVTFNQLANRLEESDVIVFPIYLDTEYEEVFERGNATSESYAIARDQLARVAELTGGQTFRAEKASDLSGVYKQVAAAIKTVYSVGYYPANAERDGTYRRVRVSVDHPDAAVRTRKGYYAK